MTVIFQNGFEEGNLSAWAGTQVINGDAPVVATFPFRGTYSGKFLTYPTLDLARSQVYTRIDMEEVYVRGYFYVNQGITALQTHDRFYFLRVLGPNNNAIALVGIRREGDQPPKWCLWYATSATTGTHTYGSTIVTSTDEKRWICVELHYNKNTGLYEVWIDGRLEITKTVTPGELTNAATVQVGVYKTGATGTTYDPTGQYTIEVYADEIIIADTYIGPAVPVLPKLTIRANPEINVPVYVDEVFVGNTPVTVTLEPGTHTVRVESEVVR
jgi:hypothetical protein